MFVLATVAAAASVVVVVALLAGYVLMAYLVRRRA